MLQRRVTSDGIAYYTSPLLERVGVPHAFSTRVGGAAGTSPPPFDSFNLGNPSGVDVQDDYARIYRHYELLQQAIGCGGRTRCWVHQVHGGNVVIIRRGESFECGPKADAMVTDDPARTLAVRVADCVPVLLASDDGRTVAAIHSGWRGVIAGAVPNAVGAIQAGEPARPRAGQPASTKLLAAIGPCIGYDHFEVGGEVLDQFIAAFGADAPIRRRDDGKGHVDLGAAIRRQLIAAGVREDDIDSTDRCTYRDIDEFYSHRRDKGVTGRMAALIAPCAD